MWGLAFLESSFLGFADLMIYGLAVSLDEAAGSKAKKLQGALGFLA